RPILDQLPGAAGSHVVLSITDPYVVHHGALGSFATIYLRSTTDTVPIMSHLAAVPGIAHVLDRQTACARFELPPARVGDLVVLSEGHTVLGRSPAEHDLSLLRRPLRSHGGVAEQTVPFLLNQPVMPTYAARGGELRNFDIFDHVLNGID